MAQKVVEDIMRGSIETIALRLSTIFAFDLTTQPEWDKFKEIFYRRHMHVHNNGYPNRSYRINVNPKIKHERLPVEKPYLDEAYRLFRLYATTIEGLLHKKFSRRLRRSYPNISNPSKGKGT